MALTRPKNEPRVTAPVSGDSLLLDGDTTRSILVTDLLKVATNITAYGAIPGINTAQQKTLNAAAILACMAANPTVIIPGVGTFYTDPVVMPVTLKSLIGYGNGCSILSGTPGPGVALLQNGGNNTNLVLADFAVEVPITNATGLQIAGTVNTTISGMRLSGRIAIFAGGNTNLTVEKNYFDNWGASAIISAGGSTGDLFRNNVIANTSNYSDIGASISINSASFGGNRNTKILNNTIGQPPIGSFVVSIYGDSDTLEIAGNTLNASAAEAINFDTNIGAVGIYRSIISHNICNYPPSASLTGSITTNVFSATAVAAGSITGFPVALTVGSGGATAVAAGTMITGQLTGAPGGIGNYTVSISQTVPSEAMVAGHNEFGISIWAAIRPVRYLSIKNNIITNPGGCGIALLDDTQYCEIKDNLIISPHYSNLVNTNPIVGYGIALANFSTSAGNTSRNTVVGNTIWDLNGFMTQTIAEQTNGGTPQTGNIFRSNNGTTGTAGFYVVNNATGSVALSAQYEGGTGQGNYAVGDVLAANTTLSLTRIPDVATGNALISGGVGALPSWGKISNAHLSNMAGTTIKGQSVGGSGAPIDLTAAQAAAIIGSVGGAMLSKVISVTKDMTQASGNVAYTGIGFQPTAVLAMCVGPVGTGMSQNVSVLGFADSARAAASFFVFGATPGANLGVNFITLVDAGVTNNQTATVASYDADGLTLTWTKAGAPTGTATIKFICFR